MTDTVTIDDAATSTSSAASASADDALHELMQRTGVVDHGSVAALTGWTFAERIADIDPEISKACAQQLEFLQVFKNNWRPEPPGKFYFPDDWRPKETDFDPLKNPTGSLSRYEMDVFVQLAGDIFTSLSHEETFARHDDPTSFGSDFLLSVPSRYLNTIGRTWITPVEKALRLHAEHSLEHFKPVVFYAGDERGAEAVISGAFLCTPGCWMRCNPEYRFPSRIVGDRQGQISDFSLLLHPIGSSREFGVLRDGHLRVSLLNPALVVGVKGPAPWRGSMAHPSSVKRPKEIGEAIRELATAVQPSLDTHLMNWQLRCEQMPEGLQDQFIPWLMVFGVIYDAERIVVVTHIPYMLPQRNDDPGQAAKLDRPRISYLSCVVDSVDFPSICLDDNISQTWCINRFRAAYALSSLQKHAFRLASLWEGVVWPASITLAESVLEREYLGATPTPSESGDALPRHEVYLEEEPISSGEQQEEIDLEIREREIRAEKVRPELLEWIQGVGESAVG